MDKEVIYKIHELGYIYPDKRESLEVYIKEIIEHGLSNELMDALKYFIIHELFSQSLRYQSGKVFQDSICNFYHECTNYYAIKDNVLLTDDKYKVYPFDAYDQKYIDIANNIMDEILDSYFKDQYVDLKSLINKYTSDLKDKTTKLKIEIKDISIKPYYGNVDFILGRVNYIITCIKRVLESPNIDEKIKGVFSESLSVIEKEGELFLSSQKEDTHENYDHLEKYYTKVLDIENNLSPLMGKIWNSYLTDPKDYVPGEPFHFLAHGTNRCVSSLDGFNKICCTLATDKCMPIPYGDVGYIVKFDPNNMDVMCLEDAGSWVISTREFIDRDFPSTWQLDHPEEETSVFYEYEKLSKLILPEDMEEAIIKGNEQYYGNALNNCGVYSEVFFKKKDVPLEALGFFSKTEEGMNIINSMDNDIPKIHLDLNEYRIKAGLDPIEVQR